MAVVTQVGTQSIDSQLAAYQRRIRSERRLRYLALAALATSSIWLLAALLFYLGMAPPILLVICILLSVLLPAAALVIEAIRQPSVTETASAGPLDLRDAERRTVQVALQQTQGNKVQAAKALGISRRALYRLIEKYHLDEARTEGRAPQ